MDNTSVDPDSYCDVCYHTKVFHYVTTEGDWVGCSFGVLEKFPCQCSGFKKNMKSVLVTFSQTCFQTVPVEVEDTATEDAIRELAEPGLDSLLWRPTMGSGDITLEEIVDNEEGE